MCTLTVKIELPDVSIQELKNNPLWFQDDNKILLDEEHFPHAKDSTHFCALELINIQE